MKPTDKPETLPGEQNAVPVFQISTLRDLFELPTYEQLERALNDLLPVLLETRAQADLMAEIARRACKEQGTEPPEGRLFEFPLSVEWHDDKGVPSEVTFAGIVKLTISNPTEPVSLKRKVWSLTCDLHNSGGSDTYLFTSEEALHARLREIIESALKDSDEQESCDAAAALLADGKTLEAWEIFLNGTDGDGFDAIAHPEDYYHLGSQTLEFPAEKGAAE